MKTDMKNLIYTLLFSMIALYGCLEKENGKLLCILNEIKTMGDTLPVVAMEHLDSIRPMFDNETEYMRNKLALLDIRLHDKAYLPHTCDSTIKRICAYFESHGTAKEQQEAYYYMGSTYRDMNDYPNAVTAFLKASYIAEQNCDIDTAIWETSYSQLAFIYNFQYNYQEALEAILKSLNVAKSVKCDNERTYMSVATSYYRNNDTINAVKYFDKAIEHIIKKGYKRENADIIASAMGKYASYGDKEKAEYCYNLLKNAPKDSYPFNYLVNASIYHEHFSSPDSAATMNETLYYTTELLEAKYDAARWLTIYYTEKKEYEKAAEYAIRFIDANNKIIEKRQFEYTNNAKNFFQYHRDKEEELTITKKAAHDRLNLIIGAVVFVFILFFGAIFYYRNKKKMLDMILDKENKIKSAKELIREKNAKIAAEKLEIERKQRELELLTENSTWLNKQLESAENDFRQLVAQNSELTRFSLMSKATGDAKKLVEKCKSASKGKYHLSDDDWKELLGAIDTLYPDFTYEVQAKFKKISEPMLRVCYLLRIGLTGPQITNLTGYPRQTVWDRIKRIETVLPFNIANAKNHTY